MQVECSAVDGPKIEPAPADAGQRTDGGAPAEATAHAQRGAAAPAPASASSSWYEGKYGRLAHV